MTAEEAISEYKKGSIRREFPGQFYHKTLDEIEAAKAAGDTAADKALKLLFQRRFDK